MSSSTSNNNQILYFMIGNYFNQKEIGHYKNENQEQEEEQITDEEFDLIINTSMNIFTNYTSANIRNTQKCSIDDRMIFYKFYENGTFYLACVDLNSLYNIYENLSFELFEDIEHQGIKKLVDKNGQLSKSGKRNLKFCIEQFNNQVKRNEFKNKNKKNKRNNNDLNVINSNDNKKKGSNDNSNNNYTLIKEDDNNESNKITFLNSQVSQVKDNMKKNVKRIINNVSDIRFLDKKSVQIKETSYNFQKDSENFEKKLKRKMFNLKLIFIISGTISVILVIYLFAR